MAQTTLSGPLITGDKPAGLTANSPNLGFVLLTQTQTLNFNATLVQNATFFIPQNSQIVSVTPDVTVAFDSATSATLSAGITTGATTYVSSVNAKTAGRASPTYSAAQLLAMSNVTTNEPIVVTVTSVGQPTAGQVVVTISYIQKTSSTD
jgi:hypothetical protein